MKNHNCALANYCDRYDRDCCQGCGRNTATYPISNAIRSKRYNLTNMFDSDVRELAKAAYDQILNDLGYKTGKSKKKEATPLVPEIKNVYFNKPMTIVIWADGTKTMVKCQKGDKYSKETGLAVAIAKKAFGTNKSGSNFNEVFKKWIPEYEKAPKKSVRKKKDDAGKDETK